MDSRTQNISHRRITRSMASQDPLKFELNQYRDDARMDGKYVQAENQLTPTKLNIIPWPALKKEGHKKVLNCYVQNIPGASLTDLNVSDIVFESTEFWQEEQRSKLIKKKLKLKLLKQKVQEMSKKKRKCEVISSDSDSDDENYHALKSYKRSKRNYPKQKAIECDRYNDDNEDKDIVNYPKVVKQITKQNEGKRTGFFNQNNSSQSIGTIIKSINLCQPLKQGKKKTNIQQIKPKRDSFFAKALMFTLFATASAASAFITSFFPTPSLL